MPMLPPAPPMFSTTNVVPSVRPMCSPTRRVTTSVGPPAANGTMTVIGLLGYCASAGVVSEASASDSAGGQKTSASHHALPQGPHTDHGR